jgi:very-short-patch-repair endonuclease
MKFTKRDVILFLIIDFICCATIVVLVLNKG